MRRSCKRLVSVTGLLLGMAVLLAAGCTTSFRSGLPDHVKTVEVHIFQNKTMYKSVEAWLTRDIIDAINADPNIRVVSRNGDAVITGEILAVNRHTMRETTSNEPGTVRITIEAEFSFYDNVKRKFIMEDVKLVSDATGMSPGIYESSRGGVSEDGERGAAKQLAGEIVRRTIGMW